MSPINYGPSDVKNPRGTPFAGMVPESFWLTKALLFDLDWILRESRRSDFNREDYPENSASLALKHCFRLLRGFEIRLAVTSNLRQGQVVGELAKLHLAEDFDNIRGLEDVDALKPNPELHLLSLDMLGVRPIRAIAFEMSKEGISAAQQAGIFCVGIPELSAQADYTLESFLGEPLLYLLEKLDRAKRKNRRPT